MGSMKDQLGDVPYDQQAFARTTDLPTSHAAAAKVNKHVNKLEEAVANAIIARGIRGATWDELAVLTGLDKASISPRFKPLRKKGLIKAKLNPFDEVEKRDGQTVWVSTNL